MKKVCFAIINAIVVTFTFDTLLVDLLTAGPDLVVWNNTRVAVLAAIERSYTNAIQSLGRVPTLFKVSNIEKKLTKF